MAEQTGIGREGKWHIPTSHFPLPGYHPATRIGWTSNGWIC